MVPPNITAIATSRLLLAVTSVNTGQAAEQIASGWLQEQGFRILDRNWRTRWCELDIVAEQEGIVRIIEVK